LKNIIFMVERFVWGAFSKTPHKSSPRFTSTISRALFSINSKHEH
jgi:hypothetical protein